MKTNNRFVEAKIKMVMKLRGISREDAMRELHIGATALQKTEESSGYADLGLYIASHDESLIDGCDL